MIETTCTVQLDGKALATDAHSLENGDITVLGGLSVKWGRASRLDQPDPTEATISIALPADETEGAAELSTITPGKRITVTTSKSTPTAQDVILVRPDTYLLSGTYDAVFTYPTYTVQPEGLNITAWNQIPCMTAGSEFVIEFTVSTLPRGAAVEVRAAYFSAPWISGQELSPLLATIRTTGKTTVRVPCNEQSMNHWIVPALRPAPDGSAWTDLTAAWTLTQDTWASLGGIGITNLTLRHSGPGSRSALIFDGRIISSVATWNDDLNRAVVNIHAADQLTTLANRLVGDAPWPTENIGNRLKRIASVSGTGVKILADSAPAAMTVRARDADSVSLIDLIREAANSTGAILWSASTVAFGEYLRLEDVRNRRALYKLVVHDQGPVSIEIAARGAFRLPASAVTREQTQLIQDTTDLATTVSVKWEDLTTTPDGDQRWVSRRVVATDPLREAAYGSRYLSISTGLSKQSEAEALASFMLTQTAPGAWTIPAARTSSEYPNLPDDTLFASLDASSRIGLPLTITGCAPWIPGAPTIPAYLDGGTITRANGHWTHEMSLTRAASASASLTWTQIPTPLTWNRFGDITWAELSSVTI